MAEGQTGELPCGWIVKQSKSHPDRVYYFNVNTGASSWEVPDLLQSRLEGNDRQSDPAQGLSSTSLPVTSPTKLPTTSGPAVTHSQPAAFTVEAEFSPETSDHSSTPSPAKRREPPQAQRASQAVQGARDNTSHTSHKQVSAKRPGKTPAVQEQRPASLPGQAHKNQHDSKQTSHSRSTEDKSSNDKHHKEKSNTTSYGDKKQDVNEHSNIHLHSRPTAIKSMHNKTQIDKSETPSHSYKKQDNNQHSSKPSNSSSVATKSPKTMNHKQYSEKSRSASQQDNQHSNKPSSRSSTTINNKHHSEKSRKVEVVSKDFPQSLLGHRSGSKSHNKSPVQKRKISPIRSPEGTKSKKSRKYDESCSKRHVVCVKSKEQPIEDTDRRKVVKCVQADQSRRRSITVKPEPVCPGRGGGAGPGLGQDLQVSTTLDDQPSPGPDHTSLDGNRSWPGSGGEGGSGGEVKVFIGDKSKLLNIQSWIDNLQQGSDSPAREFYTHPEQVSTPSMDRSTDSGYASMVSSKIRTERGWPGELRPASVEDREIVPMEVDTWELPEEAGAGGDAGVAMEIDTVLVEVRREVKANPSTHCEIHVPQTTLKQQGLLVVVDTNILISNLHFLQNFRDTHIKGHGQPVLYIPWIVLQELDRLKVKHNHKDPGALLATQTKARQAIRFLKTQFTNNHPRVLGQTPREADEAAQEFSACCNDDAILQACLHSQRLYCSSGVVLLSNDINLINKALVSSVKAFSTAEIMEGVKKLPIPIGSTSTTNTTPDLCASQAVGSPAPPGSSSTLPATLPSQRNVPATKPPVPHHTTSSHTQHSTQSHTHHSVSTQAAKHSDKQNLHVITSDSKTSSTCEPIGKFEVLPSASRAESSCMTGDLLQEETLYTEEALVEEIQCRLKTALREGLGKVLEVEMKTAYDDIWLEIVYRKPPWSLRDILECWKKHWMGVFGLVINRGLRDNVDRLLEAFTRKPGGSVEAMLQLCEDCLPVLQQCSHRQPYGETVQSTWQCVKAISDLCRGITTGHTTVQSVASLDAYLQSKLLSQSPKRVKSPTGTESVHQSASTCAATDNQSRATLIGTQSVSGSSYVSSRTVGPVTNTVCGGSNGISSSDSNMTSVPPEVAAGELLQTIWQFIYKYCDEIYEALRGSLTDEVRQRIEALIQRLVPAAKHLRILYTGLLEVPVSELSAQEENFSALSQHCNTFFTTLQAQERRPAVPVSPSQFLTLFSLPQHRQTLEQFQQQLDAMLQHLCGCLNILYPDD